MGGRRSSGFGLDDGRSCLGICGPEAEGNRRGSQAEILALDSFQAKILIELFLGGEVLLARGGDGPAVLGSFGLQLGLFAKELFIELAGALIGFALAPRGP